MLDSNKELPPIKTDEAKPGTNDYSIIEWCGYKLNESRKFVEASIGYDKIDRAQAAIFSEETTSGSSYVPVGSPQLSNTRTNRVAKTAEDITALLTDSRVFWDYSTRNPRF